MNSTILGYIGFVVAALILAWAVLELGRRFSRYKKADPGLTDRWIKFDPAQIDTLEELPPVPEPDEQEDEAEENPRQRSRQNGHYTESKKPF